MPLSPTIDRRLTRMARPPNLTGASEGGILRQAPESCSRGERPPAPDGPGRCAEGTRDLGSSRSVRVCSFVEFSSQRGAMMAEHDDTPSAEAEVWTLPVTETYRHVRH